MTTRQMAFRLKSEGKAELLRDQQEVAAGFTKVYDAAEKGANAASAATERQERRLRLLAEAAKAAAAAEAQQGRINTLLGVNRAGGGSAADSASVFIANDNEVARANAIRASIDPLWAAQNRYNVALEETRRLQAKGHLTTDEAIRKQNQLQQELDQTTAALARNTSGLTRAQMQGRLNLARQGADVFTTAAMGMSPAMIAIQQGPQILDAMATSGIRASAAVVALGAALGVAAGAAVLLGAGWMKGASDASAYERAVSGLGRTAGLTAEQLTELVRVNASAGEISVSAARDQAAAYLATGRIGGEVIGGLIRISKDYASFTSQDLAGAQSDLAKAMLDPQAAGEQMTRVFGLLTQAQLDEIEAAMKSGDQARAQMILFAALDKAVAGHADQVDEATTAWQALGRMMSNVWTNVGEALWDTERERLQRLINMRASYEDYMGRGRRLNRGQQRAYDEAGEEAWAIQTRLRRQEEARDPESDQANQQAQLAEDRRKAAEAEARRAAASARRSAREAEQEAREAQRRTRRQEDRNAEIAMAEAVGDNDFDRIRRLEDEEALRRRIRTLEDDEVSSSVARTRAMEEQGRLLAAREKTVERETTAISRATSFEVDRILGLTSLVRQEEQRLEVLRRTEAYAKAGRDYARSEAAAKEDVLEIEAARAAVMARNVQLAADEHALTLARLAGRDAEVRRRDFDSRVRDRARQIERDEELDYGSGETRARVLIREEVDAETLGARRKWVEGFVQEIRRGGIRDALAEQMENAADRMVNKLIDGLFDLDWAAIMGGGASGKDGGGFGGLLSKGLDWLIGRNADGTDYWRGGLTWVGERGPELINAPRGSQIYDHGRSMKMLAAATAGGGQTVVNHFSGNLLTPEWWDQINQGHQRAATAGATRGAQAAVGFVQGSASSVQRGDRMLKG